MKVGTIFRVGLAAAAGLWAAGCAAVAPLTSAVTGGSHGSSLEVHTETSVRLEQGNFMTVRTNVVGISKGFSLLGFIPIYPATLNKAMGRLYQNAEAQEGRPETLAHLVIEHSAIYVILFSIPQVVVRGDLIEFIPSDEQGEEQSKPLGIRPVSHRAGSTRH